MKPAAFTPASRNTFPADGRGMYHYLTGAASWFMLTMITEVFGVRGEAGRPATGAQTDRRTV
ncbi:MAG: hypothetical protein ACLU9S_03880 [Oscillospiraceae bacterium]